MKHGDIIEIAPDMPRKVRKARVAGPCYGWAKPPSEMGDHQIEAGDLYVETELKHGKNPFVMQRCCIDCLTDSGE